MLTKVLKDGSGVIVLTWFNQKFRKEQSLKLRGKQIVAYGTVTADRWGLAMANPDWEVLCYGTIVVFCYWLGGTCYYVLYNN